ncbi:hypothetical protein L249_3637 [Ophiocordyceps polyrhachis-furcata BCC 54312]|uniref:Uncharacterized protein n=1 Tax=Ophiocordyceps polyrhachis-furcata BCC 54312 TaxID=1330021 RepID=A0A367KYX8_9HYPO|nr:hypothetical protein L249_3637 [Ophiocordyceps polyrhachis-furcata BCC 54312]
MLSQWTFGWEYSLGRLVPADVGGDIPPGTTCPTGDCSAEPAGTGGRVHVDSAGQDVPGDMSSPGRVVPADVGVGIPPGTTSPSGPGIPGTGRPSGCSGGNTPWDDLSQRALGAAYSLGQVVPAGGCHARWDEPRPYGRHAPWDRLSQWTPRAPWDDLSQRLSAAPSPLGRAGVCTWTPLDRMSQGT